VKATSKTKEKLDLEHLTIIDESAVPGKPVRYTPYREILKRVKRGKALVISDEQFNIDNFRTGVRRLQKRGEFTKLVMRQQKGTDGIRRLYVINPSEEEKQQGTR